MDPVTAVASMDMTLINDAMSQFDKTSGGTIAGTAIAVNLIVSIIRNSDKIMFLKVLKLDKLIAKIPAAYLSLAITLLTSLVTCLTAISMGKPWAAAAMEGGMAALMATGIHENTKHAKKKMTKPKEEPIAESATVEAPKRGKKKKSDAN